MSYMLSVQLAATWLNTNVPPKLDENQIVLSPIFGAVTIKSVIDQAIAILSVRGNNLVLASTKSTTRQEMENIKNTLDDINNNKLPFVQGPSTCAINYPQ